MSRIEPKLPSNPISERMRRQFHINLETDISADYFNDIISLMPGDVDGLEDPDGYFAGGKKEMREMLQKGLKSFRSCSEDIQRKVENYNRDQKEPGGPLIAVGNFINSKNQEAIRQLDEMAREIKAMANMPSEEIDVGRLKKLLYEMSVLVYGESKREQLKKRFRIS